LKKLVTGIIHTPESTVRPTNYTTEPNLEAISDMGFAKVYRSVTRYLPKEIKSGILFSGFQLSLKIHFELIFGLTILNEIGDQNYISFPVLF